MLTEKERDREEVIEAREKRDNERERERKKEMRERKDCQPDWLST